MKRFFENKSIKRRKIKIKKEVLFTNKSYLIKNKFRSGKYSSRDKTVKSIQDTI